MSELFHEFVNIIYFVTVTLKDDWKPYGVETTLVRNDLKIDGGIRSFATSRKKNVFTDSFELNFV